MSGAKRKPPSKRIGGYVKQRTGGKPPKRNTLLTPNQRRRARKKGR